MKTIMLVLVIIITASTLNAQYISGLQLGPVYIKLGQAKAEIIDSVYKYYTANMDNPNWWTLVPKDTSKINQETPQIIFDQNRVIKINLNYLNQDATGVNAINTFYSILKKHFDISPHTVVYNCPDREKDMGVKLKGITIEIYSSTEDAIYTNTIVYSRGNATLRFGTVAAGNGGGPFRCYEISSKVKKIINR